jgi:5-keto-L-gluconate epimerase
MKLSVAIAHENALPSAFVVFRGIEESIRKAAEFGYDGVELALKRPDEINPSRLKSLIRERGMEISCISTGQVYADLGYSFSDEDPKRRTVLINIFKEFIDLSVEFGGMVNVGRVRGSIGNRRKEDVEGLFLESMKELGSYAAGREVAILIEPVNRYEIDFINSVADGAELLDRLQMPNLKLMPDVFHMNIEDVSIERELVRHIEQTGYIHLADSNRLAPGWGHTDFVSILTSLREVGYDNWLSIEILPKPNPDSAARKSATHILSLMNALGIR